MSTLKQVSSTHYQKHYDDIPRFVSYFYQIKLICDQSPSSVLEIGIGNKTVSDYLNRLGLNLRTCDFDAELKPDVVADIRKLPFKNEEFELISACQVLEHLPWDDFEVALIELARVSQKFVLISLPFASLPFEIHIQLPFLKRLTGIPWFDFCIRIPYFFRKHRFDGQHYWEIGKPGFSLGKIRTKLSSVFKIKQELRPVINTYHHFFLLEKK